MHVLRLRVSQSSPHIKVFIKQLLNKLQLPRSILNCSDFFLTLVTATSAVTCIPQTNPTLGRVTILSSISRKLYTLQYLRPGVVAVRAALLPPLFQNIILHCHATCGFSIASLAPALAFTRQLPIRLCQGNQRLCCTAVENLAAGIRRGVRPKVAVEGRLRR